MPFCEILGQNSAIGLLKNAITQKKIASAYLFAGPHNIGKQKTALAFTQVLNCEKEGEDACGQCDTCRQIEYGNYPDFDIIEPDGQFIKIDQIKKALDWLSLRQMGKKTRILVISQAERMNVEAANAFLKNLEEPPSGTSIILLAENPQQLLETIVSRCQLVRFCLLKKEHIHQILSLQNQLTENQTSFLSTFCMGRIQSNWIANVEQLIAQKEIVVDWLKSLPNIDLEKVFGQLESWTGSKKSECSYMLEFMEYWFRDLAWCLHGLSQEKLIYQDNLENLEKMAKYFDWEQTNTSFQQILQTKQSIEFSANNLLAFQGLWIKLQRIALGEII